jgi:transposase
MSDHFGCWARRIGVGTQPGLQLKKGRCGTMTHDYKRNGTTTLFAALDLLQGKVIGDFHKRHRHQEFLKFLRHIDREFPGKTTLHLVMDNYGTHSHAGVKAWLKKHLRYVIHYVPSSCSWLNLTERWFAELTNKRIRRDSFFSVDDLIAAINEFLAAWNDNPKPFVWTSTVDSIVGKLAVAAKPSNTFSPVAPLQKNRKRLSS